jgi:hypothetical protein
MQLIVKSGTHCLILVLMLVPWVEPGMAQANGKLRKATAERLGDPELRSPKVFSVKEITAKKLSFGKLADDETLKELTSTVFLLVPTMLVGKDGTLAKAPLKEVRRDLCQTTVIPVGDDSVGDSCSAFLWKQVKGTNGDFIFVTARHCLRALLGIYDASQYERGSLTLAQANNKVRYRVESVGNSSELDIAFLRVRYDDAKDQSRQSFLEVGTNQSDSGEGMTLVVGHSLGFVEPHYGWGTLMGDKTVLKAASFSGSSGGPVLQKDGVKWVVVGVVTGGSAALRLRREVELATRALSGPNDKPPPTVVDAESCFEPVSGEEQSTLFVGMAELERKLSPLPSTPPSLNGGDAGRK